MVVVKYSGLGRFMHIDTQRGTLSIGTTGSTHGHNAASGAFTVAATPAYLPFGNGVYNPDNNPVGPYPNLFQFLECDRNIQLRRTAPYLFPWRWNADSSNYSSTGGHLLQKPEFTAADGVSVVPWGGFSSPFYGTSAAAPHAAAIAAHWYRPTQAPPTPRLAMP